MKQFVELPVAIKVIVLQNEQTQIYVMYVCNTSNTYQCYQTIADTLKFVRDVL